MPRKRKTAVVKRPRVADTEGDEGQNLDKEDRVAKLKVLMNDFDDEGIKYILFMFEKYLANFKASFTT